MNQKREVNLNQALLRAVQKKEWNCIHNLIEMGADVKATDEEGNTVLHYAMSDQNACLIRLLVETGAEIDTSNEEGDTPLEILFRCLAKKKDESMNALISYLRTTYFSTRLAS